MHFHRVKEEKVSDHNYLGDFLVVKVPESLAMEERFIVEWEYTLFSLVPKNRNGIVLWKQTQLKETLKPFRKNTNYLPINPLTGLWERLESSLKTVLGLCFLTPRTVVGFCLSTLSRSSMIFSCCRLSYSCLVKSPLRCGVPSTDGAPDAGGVPGVPGLSSFLFPQPSMVIHWGLLSAKNDNI